MLFFCCQFRKKEKRITKEVHEVGWGNTRKYGVGSTYCTMDGIPEKNLTGKKRKLKNKEQNVKYVWKHGHVLTHKAYGNNFAF